MDFNGSFTSANSQEAWKSLSSFRCFTTAKKGYTKRIVKTARFAHWIYTTPPMAKDLTLRARKRVIPSLEDPVILYKPCRALCSIELLLYLTYPWGLKSAMDRGRPTPGSFVCQRNMTLDYVIPIGLSPKNWPIWYQIEPWEPIYQWFWPEKGCPKFWRSIMIYHPFPCW